MKLVITPGAKKDLRQITIHIAKDKPSASTKWLDEILAKMKILTEFPEIGALRADIRPSLRIQNFGNYLILYEIEPKSIRIMRVIHGARNIENIF